MTSMHLKGAKISIKIGSNIQVQPQLNRSVTLRVTNNLGIFLSRSKAKNYNLADNIVNSHVLYYQPRMRVGNVFSRVCVSVCLSMFLSVQAIT